MTDRADFSPLRQRMNQLHSSEHSNPYLQASSFGEPSCKCHRSGEPFLQASSFGAHLRPQEKNCW
ncbi:hypothetical protein BD777DRAFT_124109 [Yarrowia lipolytica]|nr:hypothetical protein BD777DRAFT_124109 [Yarrowia lipolytica]